jgi:cell division protein YceG involved in septum cleavage
MRTYILGVDIMKKIWSMHSYTILFILVSCLAIYFLDSKNDSLESDYLIVTIEPGDTIWEYAEQYSQDSSFTKRKFVKWVLANNKISEKQLSPGTELILPVKNRNDEGTQVASVMENASE